MESAASAVETRMSSATQGMGQISETSYETTITDNAATNSNVEKRTAQITLGTDAGKPVFIKTIEGCSVERKYAMSKFYLCQIYVYVTCILILTALYQKL